MAVNRTQSVFRYKTINGPLHKIPAFVKLLLFLALCVFCLSLEPLFLAAGILCAFLTAFFCKFSFREQLTDLKPVIYYAVLMYMLSVISNFIDNRNQLYLSELAVIVFIPNTGYLRVTLRLVLIVQLSSLVFRSTSSLEIRETLLITEKKLLSFPLFHKRETLKQSGITENIYLFIGFIPKIFANWSIINLAWKARYGKQGIKKIKTTVFILISLSMEKASLKSKALAARKLNRKNLQE